MCHSNKRFHSFIHSFVMLVLIDVCEAKGSRGITVVPFSYMHSSNSQSTCATLFPDESETRLHVPVDARNLCRCIHNAMQSRLI